MILTLSWVIYFAFQVNVITGLQRKVLALALGFMAKSLVLAFKAWSLLTSLQTEHCQHHSLFYKIFHIISRCGLVVKLDSHNEFITQLTGSPCQPFAQILELLPAVRWLGGVVVRASDLWSTGREFNSLPPVHCWVSTWMGDRLWEGKPSRYVASHSGQLSLLIPPWAGTVSSRWVALYPWSCSVSWCLAEC